ncbi:MAG TPA: hypothetical protein VMV94_09405 [Phycisphaerae bacterium]|nr:hypothetical protein [Phycisphaerae bacterium]
MAIEKVRERLLRSTAALESGGIPYAVIGGHAVAVWVARIDEDAVRNTADVDLLLNRVDLLRAKAALEAAGFEQADVHGVTMFLEKDNPNPRRGIRIVFAGEKVRPHEPHPAPVLSEPERAIDGFAVIDLKSLLVMKLTANRDKDRTHIRELLELNMITPELESQLPDDLKARLEAIRATPE